jgi:hypothetical protein
MGTMASGWQCRIWLGIALLAAALGGACDKLPGLHQTASAPAPAVGQAAPGNTGQTPAIPELASLPAPVGTGAKFSADQPLLDAAGQPVSSGLARFDNGQAELISRRGDAGSLEWVAYGLTGLDSNQQPTSLKLTLAKVDGSVQVGLSDNTANLWQWKEINVAGVHEIPLAGSLPVNGSGACYLVLGVSDGAAATFRCAELTGAVAGASPAGTPETTATQAQTPTPQAAPVEASTAAPGQPTPAAAQPLAKPAAPSASAVKKTHTAKQPATTAQPQTSASQLKVGPERPAPGSTAHPLAAGEDEKPAVVGTNKKLVLPLAYPALHPYDLPPQYRRLEGVVDPTIPAEDAAGWPLSSGMSRIGSKSMHLTSINGDAHGLEWVVFGGSGFSPQSPPAQLTLSFDRVDGGVWIGLPNFTANAFEWTRVDRAGAQVVSLEGRNIVRQDGEMYFALGVCGGNYAEFDGGVVEEGTGVDLLGVYLSHGYWEADKMDAIFAELQSLGVNMVVDYALRWPTDAQWQDDFNNYMLSAQRHNIGIAYCLFPALAGATPEKDEAQLNKALDEVYLLRTNPAIKAWYVHDEVLPMVAGEGGTEHYTVNLKQMQELYAKIHEADPARPQINTWTRIPTRKQFNEMYNANNMPFGREMWMDRDTAYEQTMQTMVRTTCDWVFVDEYPVGAPWAVGANPADTVGKTVGRVATLRSTSQPLYFVFQSFAHAQYGRGAPETAVFPSLEQMQAMLFASRLHGAQGAIAYSWFDLTRTDLPGRDVPGRTQCLANLRQVLVQMDKGGWPVPDAQHVVTDGEGPAKRK